MSIVIGFGDWDPSLLCHFRLQLLKSRRLKFLEGKQTEILESRLVWTAYLQDTHFSQPLHTLTSIITLRILHPKSIMISSRYNTLHVQQNKRGVKERTEVLKNSYLGYLC